MSNNKLITLGITLVTAGLLLLYYSISIHIEERALVEKIDFITVDDNYSTPSAEKFNKHIEYAQYLQEKLEGNKNLPIKNVACVYLDFAQENTIELSNLINKNFSTDTEKISKVAKLVRQYSKVSENYKTCSKYSQYATETEGILSELENSSVQNTMALPTLEDRIPKDEDGSHEIDDEQIDKLIEQYQD